jgi:hypothetical protein
MEQTEGLAPMLRFDARKGSPVTCMIDRSKDWEKRWGLGGRGDVCTITD